MIFLIAWYLQDLLQVLMTNSLLAPEVFLLALNFQALKREEPSFCWTLIAVAGGLALDLRWTGFWGFSAALYCLSVLFMRTFWFQIPKLGRSPGVFFLANLALCVVIGGIRLVFWDWNAVPTEILSVFSIQMGLTLPILLALWLVQVLSDDES